MWMDWVWWNIVSILFTERTNVASFVTEWTFDAKLQFHFLLNCNKNQSSSNKIP